jgi:hypothetical protein
MLAPTWAQDSKLTLATMPGTSFISKKEPAKKVNPDSLLTGDVSFTSNQWLEEVGEVVGNKHFGEFNLDYKSSVQNEMNKTFSFKSRVNDQEQLMFSIPEANIEYVFGNSRLVLGRTILDWGMLDGNWGLGKLNNRVNFDGFEPRQEGLTGIALNYFNRDTGFKVSVFGSVLYVPETNPGVKIDKENGTITCQNPWCKAPAPTADIGDGKIIPIRYDVEYPEISDVVFRYSIGARIGYDKGAYAIEAYQMVKPENQLSVTAEIAYDAQETKIFANITPQFYYHNVTGMDLKIRPTKYLTAYGSAYRVVPNKYPDGNEPYIQYTGLKPQKKMEEYAGTGLIFNNDKVSASVNYIARISDFDIENDPLVEYPRWNQAYHFNFSTRLTRKLSVAFDYKYDMLTEDRLTMYKANYELRPNVMVSLGANIIGTSDANRSYWSDFTNNDSFYTSFKYIF